MKRVKELGIDKWPGLSQLQTKFFCYNSGYRYHICFSVHERKRGRHPGHATFLKLHASGEFYASRHDYLYGGGLSLSPQPLPWEDAFEYMRQTAARRHEASRLRLKEKKATAPHI
jgi:hypothetical protein